MTIPAPQVKQHAASLEEVVHFTRGLKEPSVTTQRAGQLLGCSRRKIVELIDAGELAGYRLPKTTRKGRKGADPERGDVRHYRVPVVCVLLTIIRDRLPGWKLDAESSVLLLGALLRHLTLPMLRKLRDLIESMIGRREESMRQIAGPQKRGAKPDATPTFPCLQ